MSSTPSCLIVGAGDGVGAAIARAFAREGLAVCVTRRPRHLDQLETLAASIRADGGQAHAYGVDARDEAEMIALVDRIEAEVGPLQVVVFNIGANVRFPVVDTTAQVYSKVWEMAALAGFFTGREAARVMGPRGQGTILFTGATASVRGGKGFAAFSSAKFGLRAVAQSMARELGPKNIHVVHLLIDAAVDSEAIHLRMKAAKGIEASDIPPDSLTKTDSIADAYWFAHHQKRDGWTHELDLRPSVETW